MAALLIARLPLDDGRNKALEERIPD